MPNRAAAVEDKRALIRAAAVRAFAKKGYHACRVSDIAEEAGVAYGLVYHYFRNKDDILAAIFSERWAQYVEYLHEVGRMPLPFPERMRRLVHFWVEIFRREPDLMTIMINEISRSYEFLESHDIGTVLIAFDAIEVMIREARDKGEVAHDLDPQLATYVVFGAAEMVLTGYVIGTLQRHSPEAFARDEEQMLGLLLKGLSRDPR